MDKIDEKELKRLLKLKEKEMKKGRFSKFIVSSVILLNVLFTLAVLYIYLQVGSEPAVLIGAFFAFTSGELWMLSKIKRDKVKEVYKDEY